MAPPIDTSIARTRAQKRDNFANASLDQLNRRRFEEQRLKDIHNKLDHDEFVEIRKLDHEMKRLQIEIDMTVRRRSLSVDTLEIPRKRGLYVGEKFNARRHLEKYRYAENADSKPAGSSNMRPWQRQTSKTVDSSSDDLIHRMHAASIRSSWAVSRILGWYRFNKVHENRK